MDSMDPEGGSSEVGDMGFYSSWEYYATIKTT